MPYPPKEPLLDAAGYPTKRWLLFFTQLAGTVQGMPLTGILQRGLAADRPAADKVLAGTLYFSTDAVALEQSNGTIWEPYA